MCIVFPIFYAFKLIYATMFSFLRFNEVVLQYVDQRLSKTANKVYVIGDKEQVSTCLCKNIYGVRAG